MNNAVKNSVNEFINLLFNDKIEWEAGVNDRDGLVYRHTLTHRNGVVCLSEKCLSIANGGVNYAYNADSFNSVTQLFNHVNGEYVVLQKELCCISNVCNDIKLEINHETTV